MNNAVVRVSNLVRHATHLIAVYFLNRIRQNQDLPPKNVNFVMNVMRTLGQSQHGGTRDQMTGRIQEFYTAQYQRLILRQEIPELSIDKI